MESIKFAFTRLINHNTDELDGFAIYTDSLFCYNLFTLYGYPRFTYYYETMNEINGLMKILDNNGTKIYITKVPAQTRKRCSINSSRKM